MADKNLACTACQREPDFLTNADGDLDAVCDGCGQRDDIENAKRIAGEHFKYRAAVAFQEATASAVRGSKSIRFDSKRLPKREFRWGYLAI